VKTLSQLRCAALMLALAACDPASFAPTSAKGDAGSGKAGVVPDPEPAGSLVLNPAITATPGEGLGSAVARPETTPLPRPTPFATNEQLRAESLPDGLRGVVLTARWNWRDVGGPPEVSGLNEDAYATAKQQTRLRWEIALAEVGRMSVRFQSRGLPLASGSELRERYDRYGTLLLWPRAASYRTLAPGVLRALLDDGRVDVAALSGVRTRVMQPAHRFELPSTVVEIDTAVAQLTLETVKLRHAGLGAALLCRLLIEVAGGRPNDAACRPEHVPVAATFVWRPTVNPSNAIEFQVTGLEQRTDLPGERLATPPKGAAALSARAPLGGLTVFSHDELAALRTSDRPGDGDPAPEAPKNGLSLQNDSDRRMWVLLDGLPVASVKPWRKVNLRGLRAGEYRIQWRTFLSERVEPAAPIQLPAHSVFSSQPAEGRDAGT